MKRPHFLQAVFFITLISTSVNAEEKMTREQATTSFFNGLKAEDWAAIRKCVDAKKCDPKRLHQQLGPLLKSVGKEFSNCGNQNLIVNPDSVPSKVPSAISNALSDLCVIEKSRYTSDICGIDIAYDPDSGLTTVGACSLVGTAWSRCNFVPLVETLKNYEDKNPFEIRLDRKEEVKAGLHLLVQTPPLNLLKNFNQALTQKLNDSAGELNHLVTKNYDPLLCGGLCIHYNPETATSIQIDPMVQNGSSVSLNFEALDGRCRSTGGILYSAETDPKTIFAHQGATVAHICSFPAPAPVPTGLPYYIESSFLVQSSDSRKDAGLLPEVDSVRALTPGDSFNFSRSFSVEKCELDLKKSFLKTTRPFEKLGLLKLLPKDLESKEICSKTITIEPNTRVYVTSIGMTGTGRSAISTLQLDLGHFWMRLELSPDASISDLMFAFDQAMTVEGAR